MATKLNAHELDELTKAVDARLEGRERRREEREGRLPLQPSFAASLERSGFFPFAGQRSATFDAVVGSVGSEGDGSGVGSAVAAGGGALASALALLLPPVLSERMVFLSVNIPAAVENRPPPLSSSRPRGSTHASASWARAGPARRARARSERMAELRAACVARQKPVSSAPCPFRFS